MRNEKTISINSGGFDDSTTISSLLLQWRKMSGISKLFGVGIFAFLALGVFGSTLKYLEDTARNTSVNERVEPPSENQNLFSSLNPFVVDPTPTPVQLSKEYIYAGSRMLAVEDAGASASPPTDLAVWRPSNGTWWVLGGAGSQPVHNFQWGMNGDIPVPGDFDGDGKTDFSIFRPSSGQWWIVRSSDSTSYAVGFGQSGDKPVPADFDGDGRTDVGVFRNENGTGFWHVSQSISGAVVSSQFGLGSDVPCASDFDGDGRADAAVFRASAGMYYIVKSSNGQIDYRQFGMSGDKPFPADYDGDGLADIAVYRNGTWYIQQSSNGEVLGYPYGLATDTPVPNDYDGDGKVDTAVWRGQSSNPAEVGVWFILQSGNNQTRSVQWGTAGDIPVPAYYRR